MWGSDHKARNGEFENCTKGKTTTRLPIRWYTGGTNPKSSTKTPKQNKADPETIVYRISSLNPTALITRLKKKKSTTIHRFKQDTNHIKFKMS